MSRAERGVGTSVAGRHGVVGGDERAVEVADRSGVRQGVVGDGERAADLIVGVGGIVVVGVEEARHGRALAATTRPPRAPHQTRRARASSATGPRPPRQATTCSGICSISICGPCRRIVSRRSARRAVARRCGARRRRRASARLRSPAAVTAGAPAAAHGQPAPSAPPGYRRDQARDHVAQRGQARARPPTRASDSGPRSRGRAAGARGAAGASRRRASGAVSGAMPVAREVSTSEP